MDCGQPAKVDGADVTVENGSGQRDIANYTCWPGYTKVRNENIRTCNESLGAWYGRPLVCSGNVTHRGLLKTFGTALNVEIVSSAVSTIKNTVDESCVVQVT